MSFAATRAVWESTISEPTELLVALALADYADDAGRCWPSQEALAEKTRFGRTTVTAAIQRLEAAGHLSRKKRFSNSAIYTLHLLERHTNAADEQMDHLSATPICAADEHHLFTTTTPFVGQVTPNQSRIINESINPPATAQKQRSRAGTAAKPKAVKAPDPRHHAITSEFAERFKKVTGHDAEFNAGRDATALKKFLLGWKGTLEIFWKTAEAAWLLAHTDRYAGSCKLGTILAGLCKNWAAIQAEVQNRGGTPPDTRPAPPRDEGPEGWEAAYKRVFGTPTPGAWANVEEHRRKQVVEAMEEAA